MPQDPLLLTNDFEPSSEVDPLNESRSDVIGKMVDYLEVDVASGDVNLETTTDSDGDAEALRFCSFKFTGTPGTDRTITLPAIKSTYDVWNDTGDGSNLIFQTSGSPLPATVTLADGAKTLLKVSDVFDVEDWGGGSAANIGYDNSTSGLTATTVQDAIDELATTGVTGGGGGGSAEGGWTTEAVTQISAGASPSESVSNVDFTSLDATREYRVRFHGVNFSGSTSLAFRISMGSGFVSASNYNRAYGEHGDSTALTDGNLTGQTLVAMSAAGATTNAWGELQFQPAEQASIETPISFRLFHTLSSQIKEYFGAGSYAVLTAAIDGIRFLAADGSSTIDNGTFILESRPLTPETSASGPGWIPIRARMQSTGQSQVDVTPETGKEWDNYASIRISGTIFNASVDNSGTSFRVSIDGGGTFKSGGSDYRYIMPLVKDDSTGVNFALKSSGASEIPLVSNHNLAATSSWQFEILIQRNGEAINKSIRVQSNGEDNTGRETMLWGSGRYIGTSPSDGVDAIRLIVSSGIADFDIIVEGLSL